MEARLNNSDEERRDSNGSAGDSAQDRLRTELLASGLEDWVSMAEVQTIVSHFRLADSARERQDLVLKTIRSVLEDGLMEIGDLPGADGKFPAWEGSADVVIERLVDRFVHHYDDPAIWDYSIWLGLTDAGERAAKATLSTGRS